MSVGERIRNIRKNKKMTQEELSLKLGVKRSVISKYETGLITPSLDMLGQMAAALEVPVGDLMGWPDYLAKEVVDKFPDDYVELDSNGNPQFYYYAEERLLKVFRSLNEKGQQIAVERIEEMAESPRYQKDKTAPEGE